MKAEVHETYETKQQEYGKSVFSLMIAFLTATFAFQLNASMLSPALVTMEHELGTTASQIGLTQTVFFTASALFSLFLPRLADLIGRKKVLIGMLLATVAGCSIAALASNISILMIGRFLQGAAGPIVPLCMIMLRVRVPDVKKYTRLMAIITSVNGGIAGVDALAGGWIAGHWGYSPLFWIMAGIALLAAFLISATTEESTASETPGMDWAGVFFLVIAVGTALTAVNLMERLSETNWPAVTGLAIIAAFSFALFWRNEKRTSHPMAPIKYLKQRRTWGLLLTSFLTLTGVFAIMNGIVPALVQDAEFGAGIGASNAPFVSLTPYAIIGLIIGPCSGWLATKIGYLKVLRIGLGISAVACALGVFVANSPSVGALLALSVVLGISYAGMSNIILNGLGIVLSPKDNPGYLPGLNAGAFNLGAGISYTILYGVMTSFASSGGPTSGYVAGMVGGGVILLLAFIASWFIPDPETIDGSRASRLVD